MRTIEARSADKGLVRTTLIAASFGFALIQLDVTIVNVALPDLSTALGARAAELQWIVDSYALCLAAFLMGAGALGDRFGARRIYRAGLAVFALSSIACGLAPDPAALIAARAVQGLGAAAMMPCSLALLNHATPHDRKARASAIGWWTASGAVAIAAGPLIGGFLLGATGWRGIFLVNPIICAIAAAATLRVAESDVPARHERFDAAGQALIVVAALTMTGAVIEAKPLGLSDGLVPALFGVGAAAFAGFVAVEKRHPHPMAPPQLYGNPAFHITLAYGVFANLTYYGVLFVLTLYLQQVLGYSPLQTGAIYLPLTATFLFVNILSGWMVGRMGSRTPMVVGALLDAAGFALLLALGRATNLATMLAAFVLIPAGMGLGVPAMTDALLGGVDRRLSGVAAGALNAARQAAGAMGVALFGALSGDAPGDIVSGLHASALVSIALLYLAALMSARPMGQATATAEHMRRSLGGPSR